jgi:aminoglycoside phosphotransferase (APT) family kinase protein
MQNKEEYARVIVEEKLGKTASKIRQFPTGLSHYVFDVSTTDGFSCVVRIARPQRITEFKCGIKWHKIIEEVGVRLPQIFEVGKLNGHYFAVYERLEGNDLENVYPLLSIREKETIAEAVAEICWKIASIDRKCFAKIYPWHDFLQSIVSRSEREILSHGLCNPKYIGLVREELKKQTEYFQAFKPVTFLYDLSVRNVIVDNGIVTGIIDVDDVWFGDPLLAIGRGKTILMAMRQDFEFIRHWCEYIKLSNHEMKIIELYSLLYCLRFMGTIGTKLNGNASIQTNPENARLFEQMADKILRV